MTRIDDSDDQESPPRHVSWAQLAEEQKAETERMKRPAWARDRNDSESAFATPNYPEIPIKFSRISKLSGTFCEFNALASSNYVTYHIPRNSGKWREMFGEKYAIQVYFFR